MVAATRSIITRIRLATLFLAVLLACIGCATDSHEIGADAETDSLSVEDEVKFGYYVDATVCNEFPVLKKEKLTRQVSRIGDTLAESSLCPETQFTFKILNTEEINAFAGPGGFVYITVGLLDRLESKDELAAVLSHEIGHVCAHHAIKSWETAQKISCTLTVVDIISLAAGIPPLAGACGDVLADVGAKAAYISAMIIYQGYSREYEYEADELGVQTMYQAGYDPKAMVALFNKFLALQEERGEEAGLVILSSHPHLEDRLGRVQKMIQSSNYGS